MGAPQHQVQAPSMYCLDEWNPGYDSHIGRCLSTAWGSAEPNVMYWNLEENHHQVT